MAYSRSLFGSSLAFLMLSVACGGNFEAMGVGGSAGVAGTAHAGGGNGGDSSSAAGAPSGGSSGSTAIGGTTSAGASGAVTGSGGSSVGSGGSSAGSGSGGVPAGGAPSTGGTGGADCATLKTEYTAAVEKARVCDVGSTDECSKSSTLPALGCGCPTLVNAKSTYTAVAQKRYDDIQADKCLTGAICNIACAPATGASCALQTATAGGGYVCTSSLAAAN